MLSVMGKPSVVWRSLLLDRCRFWPLLALLVLVVVGLQVLHLTLLSRLEAREAQGHDTHSVVGRQLQGRMFKTVVAEMEERVSNAHRLDRSGTYHLLDNFLASEHVVHGRNQYDVSVVTQCSSDHLHLLTELSQRWGGPISVAVFTYDDDFINTVSRLLHFHFCNDHVYRHVSFHLVYPLSRAPKHLGGLSELKLSCSDDSAGGAQSGSAVGSLQRLLVSNYVIKGLEYPNNMLRNLAINYAQTPYIFLIDVDLMPSENLRVEFQKFMSSNARHAQSYNKTKGSELAAAAGASSSSLSAYVLPIFEIREGTPLPATKSQLLSLWALGAARPFYSELCKPCQGQTDYDHWRRATGQGGDGTLQVGYTVERASGYEPFYITKTSMPLYDERFKQFGYNRISQVCEMHVAGFDFHILDNAFLVHRGFKVAASLHASYRSENQRNKLLYQQFLKELKTKYPASTRQC